MGRTPYGPTNGNDAVGAGVKHAPTALRPWKFPFVIFLVASLLFGTGVALLLLNERPTEELVVELPLMFASLIYAAIGSLIIHRTSGHRIGWVFVVTGLALLVNGAKHLLPGSIVSDAIGNALYISWVFLIGFVMLWFPSGRPLSSRWQWLEWVGYGAGAVSVLGHLFAAEICTHFVGEQCVGYTTNPIGVSWIPNPEVSGLEKLLLPLTAGFVLTAAGSLVIRYVRSQGMERKQLSWLVYATTALVTATVVSEWLLRNVISDALIGAILAMLSLAMPVAAAIAILRYRLYEIDRIVSRTFGYGLLIALLALVYATGAVWLPSSLVAEESPPLFVAASTLAVAALFNPLRRRVMWWMDRRFYRSRYDATQVAESLSSRLRDQTEVCQLTGDWVWAVRRTVQPASLGLWVRR